MTWQRSLEYGPPAASQQRPPSLPSPGSQGALPQRPVRSPPTACSRAPPWARPLSGSGSGCVSAAVKRAARGQRGLSAVGLLVFFNPTLQERTWSDWRCESGVGPSSSSLSWAPFVALGLKLLAWPRRVAGHAGHIPKTLKPQQRNHTLQLQIVWSELQSCALDRSAKGDKNPKIWLQVEVWNLGP